jgi:hypothetical protein
MPHRAERSIEFPSLAEELESRRELDGLPSLRAQAGAIGIDFERLRGIVNGNALPEPPLWRPLMAYLRANEARFSKLMLAQELRRFEARRTP